MDELKGFLEVAAQSTAALVKLDVVLLHMTPCGQAMHTSVYKQQRKTGYAAHASMCSSPAPVDATQISPRRCPQGSLLCLLRNITASRQRLS